MSIPRLFLDAPLATGGEVPALPGQGRYLGSVLRRGPGDPVVLFNGVDGEFAATIATIRKDEARSAVGRQLRAQPDPGGPHLLLAAIKRDAMEWVVEKATELGVAAIQPVITARCVADRVNLARLGLIAREAAEQCERLDIPVIHEALPLHAALDRWDPAVPLFAMAERGAAPALPAAATRMAEKGRAMPVGLVTGPEGGFTPVELDAMRRRPFVVEAALGPRILRAETAAVSGLAVLQAICGDLGYGRT